MCGDRVDDTGCVQECLRDRGPHCSLVDPWQEEEVRLAPQKPGDSCSLQPLEQSQIKGFLPVWGQEAPLARPG